MGFYCSSENGREDRGRGQGPVSGRQGGGYQGGRGQGYGQNYYNGGNGGYYHYNNDYGNGGYYNNNGGYYNDNGGYYNGNGGYGQGYYENNGQYQHQEVDNGGTQGPLHNKPKSKCWRCSPAYSEAISPVLSLPTPNKETNQCGEEPVHVVNQIIPDYLEQRTIQKFLLVGSGTSTILKQSILNKLEWTLR